MFSPLPPQVSELLSLAKLKIDETERALNVEKTSSLKLYHDVGGASCLWGDGSHFIHNHLDMLKYSVNIQSTGPCVSLCVCMCVCAHACTFSSSILLKNVLVSTNGLSIPDIFSPLPRSSGVWTPEREEVDWTQNGRNGACTGYGEVSVTKAI